MSNFRQIYTQANEIETKATSNDMRVLAQLVVLLGMECEKLEGLAQKAYEESQRGKQA